MKLDFRLRSIRAERMPQNLPELAGASSKWHGSQEERYPHYWIAIPVFELNNVIDEREDGKAGNEQHPTLDISLTKNDESERA